MNEQEKSWFKALQERRTKLADALDDPAASGVINSVVEKYSDQAHFIYELLQNADDAGATLARFTLEQSRLIFSHNGSRHFTLTDPAKERDGAVGDINAITSIGNSSKGSETQKIGKFGVGFKAVFQYTNEPRVYDKNFCFKIERFFVPVLLKDDFPGRRPEDTLFVFPFFDHPDRNQDKAYDDISKKLRDLSFPLLFLSHLESIELEFGQTIGKYEKRIEQTRQFDNVTAELVCLTQNDGGEDEEKRLWLFSRTGRNEPPLPRELADHPDIQISRTGGDEVTCSVGFFLDEQEELTPVTNLTAFCFFPTKETTGLNFIIHAPFLLTDNREGIRAGDQHNRDMIAILAELAADAIFYLKEIGEEKQHRLIDDHIVEIIPCDQSEFGDIDNRNKISFLPFYNSIRELFEQKEIIPTRDGYTSADNAYWASVRRLTELFSDKQLGEICDHKEARWVFRSFGRDATQGARLKYIDSIVKTHLDEDAIIEGRSERYRDFNWVWHTRERINGITAKFIAEQSFSWLHEFYAWLHETKKKTEAARNKPIFLNQNGEAVSAVDETGQPTLFLPSKEMDENVGDYNFIHHSLLENEKTRDFIQSIGIKEPSLSDYIHNVILPQYKDGEEVDTDPHFKLFFKHYCEASAEEREELVKQIRHCEFLTYYDKNDQQAYRGAADTMYIPTPELLEWFETKPSTRFIALDEYKQMVGQERERQLFSFLDELGVNKKVSLVVVNINTEQAKADILAENNCSATDYKKLEQHNFYQGKDHEWKEWVIDGCREIVKRIEDVGDREKSLLLWKMLTNFIDTKGHPSKWLFRSHTWFFYKEKENINYQCHDAKLLKQSAWLLNKEDEYITPDKMTKSSLSEGYDTRSESARTLMEFLGVQDEDNVLDSLPDEMRQGIEFAKNSRQWVLMNLIWKNYKGLRNKESGRD